LSPLSAPSWTSASRQAQQLRQPVPHEARRRLKQAVAGAALTTAMQVCSKLKVHSFPFYWALHDIASTPMNRALGFMVTGLASGCSGASVAHAGTSSLAGAALANAAAPLVTALPFFLSPPAACSVQWQYMKNRQSGRNAEEPWCVVTYSGTPRRSNTTPQLHIAGMTGQAKQTRKHQGLGAPLSRAHRTGCTPGSQPSQHW